MLALGLYPPTAIMVWPISSTFNANGGESQDMNDFTSYLGDFNNISAPKRCRFGLYVMI